MDFSGPHTRGTHTEKKRDSHRERGEEVSEKSRGKKVHTTHL